MSQLKNISVHTMADLQAAGKKPEILFWVGCAGSFDDRAQKVTRSFVKILNHAGIEFAILGQEESCTGDPARRAGNEFIFQMMALQNIETLNMYEVKKIVCTCPHCFNTLKNDYPALGGQYEVLHHSQYLQELMKDNRLNLIDNQAFKEIVYHDSCYLGRINHEYESPRKILETLQFSIKEMERSRENGLCCGAGGAQMFKEDENGEKRINEERIDEILQSGSASIAANCPFCLTMLEDGIKTREKQKEVLVYDLAELVLNNLK